MNYYLMPMILCLMSLSSYTQEMPPTFYQDLQYRLIGPFRASRTVGAVGIPNQPNVFFIGVNNGGVWKTKDYGRTWKPIFDNAPTGSVGDIAVSPSHPDIIYVGTGEGLHRPDLGVGEGIFKSTDGGHSWSHIGLHDVQQVGRLIVHPENPDIVFVAGLGHPYGPNEERGVFRSVDGGKNWGKVLYINHNTGAIQVEFDPKNPDIIYASMWEHREGPWENASFSGPNSGLYKSIDGGNNWQLLKEGLPTADQGLGRIGIGISPSHPNRIYAIVDARQNGGIYRSDNGGQSWILIHNDRRLWGRGSDFGEIRVHPRDLDIVFIGNIASYKSTDGGKNWRSIKGAPGGDDYHRIWINPIYPDIMLFAADQGATITVNGGRTWSSWYNQPTAQLYHVTTDNQFPYWVYGGQQESGAIGISSRGDGGQISFRDWIGIGADEYAYIAPDPLNPHLIYGGRVVRFNRKTGQTQNLAPEALRSGKYRILRTMPLLFHPANPEKLLFATNVLWQTTNGGDSWEIISPDLSRDQPDVPESIGDFRTDALITMPQRGVIYAVAPSPVAEDIIWAGTDDGLVHLTQDGGNQWKDITPPQLRPWDKVSQADASHFDRRTAYIAINAIRRDDLRPYIYKTNDFGKSWELIVKGIPDNESVNVIREDPKQHGLLFAGTEKQVYYSIDDGEQWHPLRMNMPATSIRDLVIHDNDLVIGTHGRSIWILDNISPLRELGQEVAAEVVYLFTPQDAIRVRWNMFSDTPLPPEEPTGQNPPDGAILDYYLSGEVQSLVLEIIHPDGNIIRRYSNEDTPEKVDSTTLSHPTYWIRPPQSIQASPGHHRFVWDLKYATPPGARRQFSIASVYKNTPSGPHGPFVLPGKYSVRLIADGHIAEKDINVLMDPRVEISEEDLHLQNEYSMFCYRAYLEAQEIRDAIDQMLENMEPSLDKDKISGLKSLRGSRSPGDPDVTYGSIYRMAAENETITGIQHKFLFMQNLLQAADARPTTQAMDAVHQLQEILQELVMRWEELK